MPDLPKKVWIYVGIVVAAGGGLLCYWTLNITPSGGVLKGFLFWTILVIVVESLPIPLLYGGFITLGFPVVYAALLVYGPGIGSWVAICGTVIGVGRTQRQPWYRMLFNAAQLTLSISVAWVIFRQTGGMLVTTDSIGHVLPVIPSVLAYFVVNTFSVQIALALQQNASPLKMWLVNFKWTAPNYLAQTPIAFLMAVIYRQITWWGVLFLFLPLYIAHYAYKLYTDLRREHLDIIQALATAIEARDPYTEKHSKRMSEYAAAVARELGLSEERVQTIRYASILHDIGKIGINDRILAKPRPLTEEEYLKVREHSSIGTDILSQISSFRKASKLVYYHHERYNGEGYPEKLRGEDIPIGARILAVVDAYDAMTSKRPYRSAYLPQRAVAELKKKMGTQFDEKVVEAFLKVLNQNVT
ncbi:MAG: HD-GYP domain-containing protein [bacterium]